MKKKTLLRLTAVLLTVILFSLVTLTVSADRGLPVLQGEVKARIPELFEVKQEASVNYRKYQVGGDPFGVRLFGGGIVVVGISDGDCPAKAAGIEKRDIVRCVGGTEVQTVEELTAAIEASDGKPITLTIDRGGEERQVTLTPVKDEKGHYRIGIWIRDNAAGIGTMTFLDPDTGAFGGLGHGICDGNTGELLPLTRGAVLPAEISEIVRGAEGTPGELRGTLGGEKVGTILKNTDKGVFGVLAHIPQTGEVLEVGSRASVRTGAATLRCSLGGEGMHDYRIELSDIARDNCGVKCFAIHVTDPALIEKTGGIVQGMSGSPIIQDGKLIGAVTHVLIGDPTRGYGIFLENMLSELPDTLS